MVLHDKIDNIEQKLQDINSLHNSLTFTLEREKDGSLPMRCWDMKILNHEGNRSSIWYSKPSSTGLIMNYHALASHKYKRDFSIGFSGRSATGRMCMTV